MEQGDRLEAPIPSACGHSGGCACAATAVQAHATSCLCHSCAGTPVNRVAQAIADAAPQILSPVRGGIV